MDSLESFTTAARQVLQALRAFYTESTRPNAPAIRLRPMEEIASDLDLERWIRDGGLLEEGFDAFLETYLDACTRLHNPGYMAHQVATPHLSSTLAAMLDAFTNNVMAIYEMGPAATSIEYVMLNWMLRKVGWTPAPWPRERAPGGTHGGGVLTHGGSLANLTALVAIRGRVVPTSWHAGNPPRLVVLTSPHAHYSIERAAGIMGLGRDALVDLPVDARGAIDPTRLGDAYDQVVATGGSPLCLVANAGSTPTGCYDPLRELAAFCRERKLWLHVDAAHGGGALLSRRSRHLMDGIEEADSLIWDAHKMLRCSALCAAVLFRDVSALDGAFQQQASYLIHEKEQPGFDFLGRTVECTKGGLGLKMFLVLATVGEARLGAFVDRQFSLARRTYELIQSRPGFESPVAPQANIICFRAPGDDEDQLRIRDQLVRDGRFHISCTLYQERRYLRLVFMNPSTDETTIEELLETIEKNEETLRNPGTQEEER